MAAPEHVPVDRTRYLRTYESPPRRPDPWLAVRPGELVDGQPRGEQLGNPGPDQGYVLVLARRFHGKLELTSGEHERDALAGATGVALKRASLFGRAPVVHDLTVALTVWGFLGAADPELVRLRQGLFAEVAHPHHYLNQRRIADLVPDEVLRMTPQQVTEAHRTDWRGLLANLSPAAH
ncbi:MAG: hypothetical protein Q8K58_02385 [Acidimicrobiales bacterium]|nr:hypothetical protein [Acidimicrobiales bacterium]